MAQHQANGTDDQPEYEPDHEPDHELDYNPEQAVAQTSDLQQIFRDQLLACLEECSRGRHGLFSNAEALQNGINEGAWPEAARLRELAFALQSILAQSEESDILCDQFLDLCSIHGEADPGEPRLARAFLAEITGNSNPMQK